MQKQRREKNERHVLQKRNRQIKIFVSSNRCVKMENKSGQAETSEVKRKGRPPTLFEQNEEANEEINNAY